MYTQPIRLLRPQVSLSIEPSYLETDTRRKGFERLMQAVSPNAFYNSDDRPDPPKCHENTRVAVINRILDWATGKIDKDAFMLWLYGPAGAGKTAIARKVAELLAEDGLLLASFLFFRSDSKRNSMTPLVANIAYCVTCVIPGTREPIDHVLEADPLIISYSIETQLKKLFLEPLRLLVDQDYFLQKQFPPLVVIDGLDECLNKDAQINLIRFLSSSMARYQLPLKFLIVSRPEPHLKTAIALASERSIISRLELNDDFAPDEDIRHFLTDKFLEIKTSHQLRSHIPPLWPSEEQIEMLVRKASGQFLYASLAVRFINSVYDSPTRQLDIVLELRPPINHDLPFAELDTLYAFILSCTKNIDIVLRILDVNDVFATYYLDAPVIAIESVLSLEGGDVRIYLSTLSSLLELQGEGRLCNITFHHSSFMEFLHNQERSKGYFVDDRTGHTLVTRWILRTFTRNGM